MAAKPQFASEGIRHATINGHRFHLRLAGPDRQSLLWLDGTSPPLQLDRVAADFVAYLIDAMWQHQQGSGDSSQAVRHAVVDRMYKQYGRPLALGANRVTRGRINQDLDRIFGTLMTVAEGGCPIEAGVGSEQISHHAWTAPARMDLAVTYRCNLDCPHCYAGGPRQMAELDTATWLRAYKRLWRAGIPQLVFTGGEPTLRDDLVELVAEAEEFVTGLVTNGTRLTELAGPLRDASLDYIQVTLESHDAAIHNAMVGAKEEDAFGQTVAGIRKASELDMQVVTNTTLTRQNGDAFQETLRFGKELGLESMACNSLICSGRGKAAINSDSIPEETLKTILADAMATAQQLGINLQWYTPTCYHKLNPLELGFGPKCCSAAAHNMTIQPDGSVIPCQSWPETVGNILTDDWESIWSHPLSVKLRDHGFASDKAECTECDHLPYCGGGCPLDECNDTRPCPTAPTDAEGGDQ